jgi:hypothetical protein
MMQCKLQEDRLRTDSKAAGNMVLPQWGLTSFYETFVRKQTAMLLLSLSDKNPPLRQYPNRYRQAWKNALKSQKRFSQ